MSTKFILHGGLYHERINNNIQAFGEQILKVAKKDSVKILLCPFARPKELWQDYYERDKNAFLAYFPKMQFILVEQEKFLEQAKEVDVIYFRGGDAKLIFNIIKNINGWQEAIKGKIFVGESAGAQFVSMYYFGLKTGIIEKGFGLLPIKFIAHWNSDYNAPNIDWDKAYNILKNYNEDLPVVTLKEGEFKVFNNE